VVWRDGLDAVVGGGQERDLRIPGHEERDQRDQEHTGDRKLEQRSHPDRGHPQLAARIGPQLGKERKHQRTGHGAQAHGPNEEAEALRPDVQDLVGEQGNQRQAVHREERENRDQEQQHADHGFTPRIRDALQQPGQPRLVGVVPRKSR